MDSLGVDSTELDAPSQSGGGGTPGTSVCEEVSSSTETRPIVLAFTYDVSGSMGKLDPPNWWHDPASKWTPIAAATRSFFGETSVQGISASLSLFPKGTERCSSDSYETPDVPLTGLPSDTFGQVLDDYEAEVGVPLAGGDWRGGTPTLAAFQGTLAYLEAQGGDYDQAIVLVTDGLPSGCDDDELTSVLAAVENAKEAGIATYVIGVENPSSPPAALPATFDEWGCGPSSDEPCAPPANLSPLHAIAEAGGTGEAFLIDTGNPEQTQADFTEAILAIQRNAASCSLQVPPHPETGLDFDLDYVSPVLEIDGTPQSLAYDESCETESGFRFEDADGTTRIELCEASCSAVTASQAASFRVEFLCSPRPDLVR